MALIGATRRPLRAFGERKMAMTLHLGPKLEYRRRGRVQPTTPAVKEFHGQFGHDQRPREKMARFVWMIGDGGRAKPERAIRTPESTAIRNALPTHRCEDVTSLNDFVLVATVHASSTHRREKCVEIDGRHAFRHVVGRWAVSRTEPWDEALERLRRRQARTAGHWIRPFVWAG